MNRVSDGMHTCTILRSQQFLLGGDAASCQITLTTCYHWFYNLSQWFDGPNLYWQCVSSTCSVVILLRPSYIGERSIVMSVSVCLCVRLSVRKHIPRNYMYMSNLYQIRVHATHGCGSVYCPVAVRYVMYFRFRMGDVVFARNDQKQAMRKRRILKAIQQGAARIRYRGVY